MLGPTPTCGLYVRHVRGLEPRGIRFERRRPDQRPALVADEVTELNIDHFTTPIIKGRATARLSSLVPRFTFL